MKNNIRLLLQSAAFTMLLAAASTAIPATLLVTTTQDAGPGSLRQALIEANSHAGPDTILFNIPKSGNLFNGSAWFIEPATDLPELIDDSTMIDGTSQTAYLGDTNSEGPEIVISGYQGKSTGMIRYGLIILSAGNTVRGVSLCSFLQDAIKITGASAFRNRIMGNYIGLNFTGMDTLDSPNVTGIYLDNGAHHNLIGGITPAERNIISGNRWAGIYFFMSDSNRVMGNYIGTGLNGLLPLGNRECGIDIWNSRANLIGGTGPGEANLISGNSRYGIVIYYEKCSGNRITGNLIGCDVNGSRGAGEQAYGISLENSPNSVIGPGNVIRYNQLTGINVTGELAKGNTITRNSISDNSDTGITLGSGANGSIMPPELLQTMTGVTGKTLPFAIVEIFSDTGKEGLLYEGTATADDSGSFSWTGVLRGPRVTSTATDPLGNTSAFSMAQFLTGVSYGKQDSQADQFALAQNYPNPFNPATTIDCTIPAAGFITLQVFNIRGEKIRTLLQGDANRGLQSVIWDGLDDSGHSVPAGIYLCRLSAGAFYGGIRMILLR